MSRIWSRVGYRPWARLLHRFNLHHTRRIGPLEDGVSVHRCEWCGVSRREIPYEVALQRMAASRSVSDNPEDPA